MGNGRWVKRNWRRGREQNKTAAQHARLLARRQAKAGRPNETSSMLGPRGDWLAVVELLLFTVSAAIGALSAAGRETTGLNASRADRGDPPHTPSRTNTRAVLCGQGGARWPSIAVSAS